MPTFAASYFKGFQFFFGVVEDRNDPLQLGRVRIRAFGIHTDDKADIPTDTLPWASPVMPFTSASISGIGTSPTGPVEGTWVFGFFADGKQMQMPMILGTLIGEPDSIPKTAEGFYDPEGTYPKLYYDKDSQEDTASFGVRPPKILPESDVNRIARGDDVDKSTGYIWTQKEKQEDQSRSGEDNLETKINNRITDVPKAQPPFTPSVKDGAPPGKDFDAYFKRYTWNEPNPRYGGQEVGEKDSYNIHDVRDKGADPIYGGTSKYPLNHTHVTESGHILEVDDSLKAGRIHQYHHSGTFYEIQPNGTRVTKIVGDDFEVVMHDKNMVVSGNVNITVNQSDLRLYVNKDKETEKGGDIYFECDGDFNLNVKGDMTTKVQGSEHKEVITDSATQINGKQSLRVSKDRITTIEGDHREDILGDHDLNILGNRTSSIEGTDFGYVNLKYTRFVTDHIAVSSTSDTVNITASANVNINSRSNVNVDASAKIDMDATGNIEITTPATVDMDGSTEVDIDGAIINLN